MTDEVTPPVIPPVADPVKPTEPVAPVSAIDEAKAIVEQIKEERVKLDAENKEYKKNEVTKMLSSTAGGRIPAQEVDPAQQKTEAAAEFFKGTQLEKDIRKANKPDE